MSEDNQNRADEAESSAEAVSTTEPREYIAFDLGPVREAHPEHASIIDSFSARANPPLTWGLLSTAALLKSDYAGTTVEEQLQSNLWSFIGETCEERDEREIEDFRLEMIGAALAAGASKELRQILFDLKPAYYLITYTKGAPATKVLKT